MDDAVQMASRPIFYRYVPDPVNGKHQINFFDKNTDGQEEITLILNWNGSQWTFGTHDNRHSGLLMDALILSSEVFPGGIPLNTDLKG